MLTAGAGVSFHEQDHRKASYVHTYAARGRGRTAATARPGPFLLLGEGPQPAQGPVLGDPDRTG